MQGHYAFAGEIGIDFNLTPLYTESSTRAWGILFTFQATFDAPGIWRLGLKEHEGVNRTYYQDENQAPDYYWSDISNAHVGVNNTVRVAP